TKVDLLGRTTFYTDALGTTTHTLYDQAGRVTDTKRTLSGGSEAALTHDGYDNSNRLTSLTEYASNPAVTINYTYDGGGRLATVARPNGVTTTYTYDPNLGSVSRINHQKGGSDLSPVSPWTYAPSGGDRASSAPGDG